MFRTRLLVGTSIVAALVALGWLDHRSAAAGLWLAPVLVLFVVLGTRELLDLCAARGLEPSVPIAYAGSLLVAASPWIALASPPGRCFPWQLGTSPIESPSLDLASGQWTLMALALAVIAAFAAEIMRYDKPGRVTANLAASLLAVCYLGFPFSFAVRLRLTWGIGALASVLLVVKLADTGAYAFGKAFGRRKLAPVLSPNKTIEGALGAMLFALLASWAAVRWLIPACTPQVSAEAGEVGPAWGWLLYGLLLGGTGILGDLAESLLKRDSSRKDSSSWVPGLGGVLDMLDSLILAAPVAYVCWAFGLLGGSAVR